MGIVKYNKELMGGGLAKIVAIFECLEEMLFWSVDGKIS